MAKETHLFLERAVDSKTSSVPTDIEVIGKAHLNSCRISLFFMMEITTKSLTARYLSLQK